MPLPRISVVTPTFNRARFLPEAIRSVLDQGYPDLEYLVVDGGSTDGTREAVAPFLPRIDRWISEPDRGQADALNKGFRLATGDVFAWLDSDDRYLPGAIELAGRHFERKPECLWLAAGVEVDAPGGPRAEAPRYSGPVDLLGGRGRALHQQGIFIRRSLFEKLGPFDDRFPLCFPFEYWARAALAGHAPDCVGATVATFRLHPEGKTTARRIAAFDETWRIARSFRHHLRRADWCRARAALLYREAEHYPENAYALLAEGDRAGAVRYLLRRAAAAQCVQPTRRAWEAFWRVFAVGRPPAWFDARPHSP